MNIPKIVAASLLLGVPLIAPAEIYALLIGVNRYPVRVDPRGKVVDQSLRGAVDDARDLARALQRDYGLKPSHTTLLLDRAATAAAIQKWVTAVGGKLKRGDEIVFTFSGHGTRISVAEGMDSAIVLPNLTCIRGRDFGEMARALAAHGIDATFLFDSCFSGGMSRGPSGYFGFKEAKLKSIPVRPGAYRLAGLSLPPMAPTTRGPNVGRYAFVYASQPDQPSIEIAGDKKAKIAPHGLFTLALLSCLEHDPRSPVGRLVQEVKSFFEDTFGGRRDIKQRPSCDFSTPARGAEPLVLSRRR